MLQWIKKCPIPLIYLTVLLVWLYYAIYQGSVLAWGGFGFSMLLLWVRYAGKQAVYVCMILVFFACLFSYRSRTMERGMELNPPSPREILLLPDTIKVNGDSLSFRGKSQGQLFQAFYKLQTEQEKQRFQAQSDLLRLEIEGELSQAEGRRNFAGFDYREYLKTQGIYRTLTIEHITSVQPVKTWNVLDKLSSWRRAAVVFIKQTFPQPMSNYMTGLLFGHLDTDFEEMNDLYSSLGIIHLFALSGMQVGFFMDGFRKLLLRLGLKMETVTVIQYPFSLLYAGLTGFSVSVVRSLLQKLWGQAGVKGLDNFALTMMTLSLLMPNFLLTAGGILSCAYSFLLSMIDTDGLSSFKKICYESAMISIGMLPILLFFFGEFQPWSIPLTFFFSFIFDVLLLPGLSLIFLLAPLVAIAQVNPLFQLLEQIIRWVGSLTSHPLVLGQPSPILLLALLLFLAIFADKRQEKAWKMGLLGMITLLFFICKHPLENEVTIVDIGQGDSIFLRDMTGRNILIDVGGRVEVGKKENWQQRVSVPNAERTLIPYLKSRGVGCVDKLVLTHTDTDHMGDMLVVAKALSIREVYVSKGSLTKQDFVEKLDQLGVRIHVVEIGDRLPIMGGYLEVLYPSGVGDGGNNDSIVLYGELLKTRFLFTGDLETEGEEEMMARFPNLRVDVLKAGHHGSKGSSSPAFLDQIKPQLALISAGKKNRYKHPHQETLDRFDERQIKVLRTDEQGAIRFTGWSEWKIETVR
ncbi:DNA internalization-related competence protein ComEC/Rec2 [Streptococcus himalayensis]|uniref:DNA internalization-related competence protein ComEC/Rec2 n=1 Tax=Streptococcus himalayensis TaxID=1888195 RepID=A0A917A737_9STRE|nr:DNA internalization-related competence protein ComEC/Rec2 [Streptococcus himalayensis]GGE27665.1 DNA internalization-related competence protein ComEC/Rec2 [Streptococcus himalayensis]